MHARSTVACARFTKRFDMAVGLVILVNAAAIAIETDMPKDNVQGQQILFIAENVFCVIFTCEVIIRVWLGCKDYFRDPCAKTGSVDSVSLRVRLDS